jgi:asparagine synthase (glutamine-hydrolysing)
VPDVEESNPLKQLLALDFANTLPEYILRKGDLCTMAHGLELRAPLLDHVWVEALLGVPDHERFTRPAKQLLAAAMPQLAPLDLFGRKKRGFNPPLAPLLAGPLANRLEGLAERLAARSPSLDAPALRRLLSQPAPDEQRLQCLLLDESLAQLSTLRGK